MSLTWLLTKTTQSSTNAWCLDGTPEVALRVMIHMNPNVRTPSARVVINVSQCSTQKPPPSATGDARNVKWCWMYSVGLRAVSSAIAWLPRFALVHEKRHAEHDHRHGERTEKSGVDDAVDGL